MKILKSKRLLISTMTNDELRSAILSETDDHMKNALREMLHSCLDHPDEHQWYTNWKIALHDGTVIGGLGFKGPQKSGAVEIGYHIDEEYRNKGYATEAVKHAIAWAFSEDNVYFIIAETNGNNLASMRLLEKLSFSPSGTGEEGDLYEKERDKSSWMALFMSVGMSCGVGFGSSMDNIGLGISIGMCFGIAIGAALDNSDSTKRKKLREARNVK